MERNTLLGTLILGLSLQATAWAQTVPDDYLGTWRTIDDRTGYTKALVEIRKADNGTYEGYIIKALPRPGYQPTMVCSNCPGEFKNKPVMGMRFLWDMKPTASGTELASGRALDPNNGKIYNFRMRLNGDKNRLTSRGFVGVSMLGRSQTWIRAKNGKDEK